MNSRTHNLPIYDALPELREKLAAERAVILQAPPGSGKSTIVPWELLTEDWLEGRKIVMLEPRRIAARTVAERMAYLLNEHPGKRIGYRVRFESRVSDATRVEVVTEGILTRMLQRDNALENVGLVIFDEFHERSLHADLAFVLLRQVQQLLRPDLRMLVMSATLQAGKLSENLLGAPVVRAEGRQYPVDLRYVTAPDAPLNRIVSDCTLRAMREHAGDALVFLPGAAEIRRTAEDLEQRVTPDVRVLPLYGDLSSSEQQAAIVPDPAGRRKIVLATSIAETSLTIEGITIVIDSGLARVPRFEHRTGLSRLATVKVTKDAADQRAGRAGRLSPGVAYRLWSERSHAELLAERSPEILEADLAPMMLELANWGIVDLSELDWITTPPDGAVQQARELLHRLGALSDGRITEAGKRMLLLPAHPRIAHMLIESQRDGLAGLACDIAAILEERDPFPRTAGADLELRIEQLSRFRRSDGRERGISDKTSLDRVLRAAQNWRRMIAKSEHEPHHHEAGRVLAYAYPDRVAKATGERGRYRLANGSVARLDDHDPLAAEPWIVIADLGGGAGQKEARIALAAAIDQDDVIHLAKEKDVLEWDEREGTIKAQRELRLGDIVISSKPSKEIPLASRIELITGAIRDEGLSILSWSEAATALRARIASLSLWRPQENFPDVTDAGLLTSLEDWLGEHLSSVRKRSDLETLDMYQILRNRPSWEVLQRIDSLAPASVTVPTGSEIRLKYAMDGAPPVLAVRLQEVFGMADTPTVNEGRTRVLIHLLSPGFKPVQITQDLRSFWNSGYHEVRKELRIRYPRHAWPDDPWSAEPIRGAKRRPR